jgi:hypothetical protein
MRSSNIISQTYSDLDFFSNNQRIWSRKAVHVVNWKGNVEDFTYGLGEVLNWSRTY